MHINDTATFGTCPFLFFFVQKMLNSICFNVIQIINHAHVVLCPVSFIQTFHPRTWKSVAIHTIVCIQFCAVADDALLYRFIWAVVCSAATRTMIFCSQISHTDTAVHATWRNEHFFIVWFHRFHFH